MRKFFSELKRRHVFRVAWIYVVAAWVVIQVVSTLTPALYWPPDLVRIVIYIALACFPLALILAWAFDLTAEGVEREDDVSGKRSLMRARWLRPVVGVALTLVFIVGGLVWWVKMQQKKAASGPLAVAVFPFSVQGGPAELYLREGMVSLLSTKLDGAGELRATDPDAIITALGKDVPEEIPQRTAEAVARRFGAQLYILGAVTEMDGKLTLSAVLHDMRRDDGRTTQASVTDTKENVLALVDQLTVRLLSEQFREPANRLERLAGLTTSSLPALKSYLAGETDYRSSRWGSAIDWFKRALTEDSTYALAAYRLAAAAEWAADFETARPATDLAMRHRDRLTKRDRSFLEGFAAWQSGNPVAADSIYQKLVKDYPEDVEAWYRLGEIQFHYNPVRGRSADSARLAFRNALALDPNLEALRFHLMELALSDRRFAVFDSLVSTVNLEGEAALRRTAPRVFASGNKNAIDKVMGDLRASADGTVFAVAAATAQYLRDFDNAERVAALLTDSSRMWVSQGVGHLFMAELNTGRGRWNQARTQLEALSRIGPCGTAAPERFEKLICYAIALEHEALYSLSPLIRLSDSDLRNLRGRLDSWQADSISPFAMPPEYLGAHNGVHPLLRSYLAGMLSARLNEPSAAEASARLLDRYPLADSIPRLRHLPRRLASGVRAQAAFASGNYDDALRLLDVPVAADVDYILASPFFSHAPERMLYGELLMKKKRYDEALPWFESLLQSRSDLYLAGPSLLRQAEIFERRGDKTKALALYEEFEKLWSGADAALHAPLVEARKKIEQLQ
jgi:tetratricopeptide (TPR) repeat protein